MFERGNHDFLTLGENLDSIDKKPPITGIRTQDCGKTMELYTLFGAAYLLPLLVYSIQNFIQILYKN